MQDLLTTAVEMHQMDHLDPAPWLYHQVLAHEQDNADVLHQPGVFFHQQRDPGHAVEHIGQAVVLRANIPAFQTNLGQMLVDLGQPVNAMRPRTRTTAS